MSCKARPQHLPIDRCQFILIATKRLALHIQLSTKNIRFFFLAQDYCLDKSAVLAILLDIFQSIHQMMGKNYDEILCFLD